MLRIEVSSGKSVFFLSDLHLGAPCFSAQQNREKEELFIRWLEERRSNAAGLVLLGDILDFWYEYKLVVPKGFFRLFAALHKWHEEGIPVWLLKGNHDTWASDYLKEEIGIEVLNPQKVQIGQDTFYLSHGDEYDTRNKMYLFMRWFFRGKVPRFFYSLIHPRWGVGFGRWWSQFSSTNRPKNLPPKDWSTDGMAMGANKIAWREKVNYVMAGHRHLPCSISLEREASRYVNTGDWVHHYTYAEYDGKQLLLHELLSTEKR